MISKKITIRNQSGLHARPATLFVKETNKFKSEIRVRKEDKEVNGKSILSILTLEAIQGSTIEIKADGIDETEALDALITLLSSDLE
ncbi:MAG: HPr family phosphocarrier protein [Anaerolineaceae bacterium]|nr:HPr family phosphocarrier protein [Anaerolineaceae bacterium]